MKLSNLILVLCLAIFSGCSNSDVSVTTEDYSLSEIQQISSLDERFLTYYLERPVGAEDIPILVVIDGSGCSGQLRPVLGTLFKPSPEAPDRYARIAVEKPGVASDATGSEDCSEDFLKHYTMTNRVEDHLRVLQHLRKTAPWWNGELYIWGWSDGGDIGMRLLAYYPDAQKAILGSFGGGFTMLEQFQSDTFCPAENYNEAEQDKRDICFEKTRQKFQAMSDNPTWQKNWAGQDNSWRVWSTRLYGRSTVLLNDVSQPVLIIHGAQDVDALESSRKMMTDLDETRRADVEVWEIKDIGHSFRDFDEQRLAEFTAQQLDWFFNGPN